MRLMNEQRERVEAWMAGKQHTFGLFRKPISEAWFQYRQTEGAVPLSLRQFRAVRLYAFCKGAVREWRGARKGPPSEEHEQDRKGRKAG